MLSWASLPAAPPAAEGPDTETPPGFITYAAPPPSAPPLDTEAHAGELPGTPAEEAAAAPVAASEPAPPAPSEKPRKPPKQPKPPKPPKVRVPLRERWTSGQIAAVVITVLLLVGSGVAALVLSGRSGDSAPASDSAARGTPARPARKAEHRAARPNPDAALRSQVRTLAALMKTSVQGRAMAVQGDVKAAIANRSQLLKDLQALRAKVADARLKAGVGSFAAAIRESLRQNRECGAKCTTSDLNKVNRLKRQAVAALNPLLRRFGFAVYTSRQI